MFFFTYGNCQSRTAHTPMLTSAELVSNLQTQSRPLRFKTNAEQLFIVSRNNCGVSEWQHRKACLRETTAFISILSFHKNHGHNININYCCEMRNICRNEADWIYICQNKRRQFLPTCSYGPGDYIGGAMGVISSLQVEKNLFYILLLSIIEKWSSFSVVITL